MTPISLLLVGVLATSEWQPVRTDHEGVGLPAGVVARIGSTRFRHEYTCDGLHFTKDGKSLVGVTTWHTAYVWDVQTGVPRVTMPKSSHHSDSALLPDGNLVIRQREENGYLTTYNLQTGAKVKQLRTAKDSECESLSVDGTRYVGFFSGLVMVFDTATMKPVHETRLSIADFSPNQIILSRDNKLVAASFNQWTEVRELATGNVVFSNAAARDDEVQRVAFTPDGKHLLRSIDADTKFRLEVVELKTEKIRTILETDRSIRLILCTDDNQSCIVASGIQDVMKIELQSGNKTKFKHAGQHTQSLALSPDGKTLAVGGYEHRVRLLDVATGQELPQSKGGMDVRGRSIEFTDGGRGITLYQAEGGSQAQLFDVAKQTIVKQIDAPDNAYVRFLPNGEEYVITTEKRVEVRKNTNDAPTLSAEIPQRRAPGIRLAGNGRYLFADGLDHAHYWDLQTRKKYEPLVSKDLDLVPSPDGQRVMKVVMNGYSRDGENLWANELHDLSTRLPSPGWSKVPSSSRFTVFAPDSTSSAIKTGKQELTLFDLRDGRARWRCKITTDLSQASFSPDGRSLAVVENERRLIVLEASTGKRRFEVPRSSASPLATAFSPDGRYLAYTTQLAPLYLYDFRGEMLNMPHLLTREDRERLWQTLLGENAEASFQALRQLAAAPESTISLIREKVKPVASVPKERVESLIKDLDAPAYRDREAATKELKGYADRILAQLEEAEQTTPSPEVRLRIEKLRKTAYPESQDRVRQTRIIEVVEWCGTPDAKKLLAEWSQGAKGASFTLEATTTLARMNKTTKP